MASAPARPGIDLTVAHPAPVSYRPPRARGTSEGLLLVRTPATLRRLAPDEAVPAATFRGEWGFRDLAIHETEDGLFLPLRRPYGTYGTARVTEEDFVDALGRDASMRLDVHSWQVSATPIAPRRWGMPAPALALDGTDPCTLVHDGRARAAADLAAYLAEDVRLHGGGVLVRARGPLLSHAGANIHALLPDIGGRLEGAPHEMRLRPPFVRLADAAAFHAFLREECLATGPAPCIHGWGGAPFAPDDPFPALALREHGDRDLLLVATLLAPAMLHEATRGELATRSTERLPVLAEGYARLARTFRTGRPSLAEAEEAVALAREGLGLVANPDLPCGTDGRGHGTLLRYLERFVAPRFERPDPEAEAALDALAP